MKLVTLAEFQHITGVSDSTLVKLLSAGPLDCRIDENRGILINIEAIGVSSLMKAMTARQADILARRKQVVAERLGKLIGDELEVILRDAVGAFLRLENNPR